MKIRAIRTYQSVIFDKKNESYFANLKLPNKVPTEITLLEKLNVVEVKNDNDHILIPLSNVSCIHVWTDASIQEQTKKDAEAAEALTKPSGIRASEIKRPR